MTDDHSDGCGGTIWYGSLANECIHMHGSATTIAKDDEERDGPSMLRPASARSSNIVR